MSAIPAHTQYKIETALNSIGKLFTNPKITLVVRSPQLVDGDLVMTADDLDLAIKAIERLKHKDNP